MPKFPVDAPADRVLRALRELGFEVVRRGNHVSLARAGADGTVTPMTLPGHRVIKARRSGWRGLLPGPLRQLMPG